MALNNENLQQLTSLARHQIELEQLVLLKEQELKAAKEALTKVSTLDIPELMNELDIQSFKLWEGASVTVKKDLRAYIRKEDEYSVYNWLRETNNAGIIKTNISATFGMGEEAIASDVFAYLQKFGCKADKKDGVHWATLNKFVKELLEDGKSFPEQIQVQYLQEAKIK